MDKRIAAQQFLCFFRIVNEEMRSGRAPVAKNTAALQADVVVAEQCSQPGKHTGLIGKNDFNVFHTDQSTYIYSAILQYGLKYENMEDQISKAAVLIGDPVRAKVLWALLDGRAYTATELAVYTDTTLQNLCMHLNKLVEGSLLTVERQGRHRYYSFSRPEVASAVEGLAALVPVAKRHIHQAADDRPIKYCRTCYDHLAGKIGVAVAGGLIDKGYLLHQGDEFLLTESGRNWFASVGVDTYGVGESKRSFARACLDWSERRHHLAGALGAALLQMMLDGDWLRRKSGTRAVLVTGKGREALRRHL